MSFHSPIERSLFEDRIATAATEKAVTESAAVVEGFVDDVIDITTTNIATAVGEISIETSFDAIVDASGGGDYLTIANARAAGKKTLYVRNGAYAESAIELVNGLRIEGESTDGVELTFSGGATFTSAAASTDLTQLVVSVTADSNTVTLVSGSFSPVFNEGAWILIEGVPTQIAARTSNTVLELVHNYRGETGNASVAGPNGIFIGGVRLRNFTIKHSATNTVLLTSLLNAKIDSVIFRDPNAGVPASRNSLEIDQCVHLDLTNCVVAGAGFESVRLRDSNAVRFIGCRFIDGESGVSTARCAATAFTDCIFERLAQSSLTFSNISDGARDQFPSGALCVANVEKCKFFRCRGTVVNVEDGEVQAKVAGCDFNSCKGTGAFCTGRSALILTGSSFWLHQDTAVISKSSARLVVANSIFSGVQNTESVIVLISRGGSTIAGNTFADTNADRYIDVGDGISSAIVAGNVFMDRPNREDVRVGADVEEVVVANNNRESVTIA